MLESAGVIHSSDRLVQVIAHSESARSQDSEILSDLSPHPMVHGTTSDDWLVDDEGNRIVESRHKLGGRPFLLNPLEGPSAAMAKVTAEGYFQIVQIDFPNAKDADIAGNWPFADGIFHILGKEPFDDCSWRYFWER